VVHEGDGDGGGGAAAAAAPAADAVRVIRSVDNDSSVEDSDTRILASRQN
jgi:hypothetical protein